MNTLTASQARSNLYRLMEKHGFKVEEVCRYGKTPLVVC